MAGGVAPLVTIDTREWARLKRELDAFEPALALGLRREIKKVGELGVARVKAALAEPSPDGGDRSVGARRAAISGTRTAVSFGARAAGVKITTSGSRLAPEHAGWLKAYNTASWRHPVFGTSAWVEQQGRPYFGAAILEGVNTEMTREITKALDVAMRAIGARGI